MLHRSRPIYAIETLARSRQAFRPAAAKRPYTMTSDLYEEQRLPRYKKRQYYPLHIGQRLADRYRVITKLGFGAYSTVWLAKDER